MPYIVRIRRISAFQRYITCSDFLLLLFLYLTNFTPCGVHWNCNRLAVLCPILNELYIDIFRKGNLTNSMKKGMVKIIYKRKGDKRDLKNYRPLSMLNTDYKILAKILANRLKIVVPNIITTNQTYAVLKRDITDVINNIRDIIWYMK